MPGSCLGLALVETLRATLTIITSATSLRPRSVLPTPTKFDGKPYRFKTWLPTINAKIAVDGQAIGDDTAKFYFVWDNLEPQIQAMVLPQLSDAEEREHEPLPAYIARFKRILHEAKGRDWPAAVKITTFRQGLNASIQRSLDSQLLLPDKYPEFLQATQRLATRSATYSSHSAPAQPRAEKMDLSAAEALNINTIDVAEVTHAAYTTRAQKARCCVRCGSQTHWVQSCPRLPQTPAAAKPPAIKHQTLWEPDEYDYHEYETSNDSSDDNCDLVRELSL
ncbi:hypothetical protein K469DRAFT_718289 [Zopfia rhizophila CBS 207.26]|uniref:CCHC-type domain-containing protein n=1 Tax=Zopfia rhizophila CBS 207.26 TaxID=1314779 RepID=A0A6A6DIW4_9PEZI|nr:hypothetical protein K469DRAFT_718289 [Zopfia rhizophila CBS 207.26]